MKKIFLLLILLLPASLHAEGKYSLGFQLLGDFQLRDAQATLSPGMGLGFFAGKRFGSRWTGEVATWFSVQDGTEGSDGDNKIFLVSLPEVSMDYHLIENSKWDILGGLGVSTYFLTEGSKVDATDGFGIGPSLRLGVNRNLGDRYQLGLMSAFRFVPVFTSMDDSDRAYYTLLPLTLHLRFGYQF